MGGADAQCSMCVHSNRGFWRHWKWRHISIVVMSAAVCSLSISQLFLSVLVFTYIDIPQCVLVGQNLALVASILSFSGAIFYNTLARRLQTMNGERDHKSFCQNVFFSILTLRTTVWWLTCLNGAFIYGFNKNQVGCPPAPISAILGRIMTACQMYQVSLCASILAFISSAFELALFSRCKRPFLTYKMIFSRDAESNSPSEEALRPPPNYVDKEIPTCSPASSFSMTTSDPLPCPLPAARPRTQSWSLPSSHSPPADPETHPRIGHAETIIPQTSRYLNVSTPGCFHGHNKPLHHQPIHFTMPNWSCPRTDHSNRNTGCTNTLVDPSEHRSSTATAVPDYAGVTPLPRTLERADRKMETVMQEWEKQLPLSRTRAWDRHIWLPDMREPETQVRCPRMYKWDRKPPCLEHERQIDFPAYWRHKEERATLHLVPLTPPTPPPKAIVRRSLPPAYLEERTLLERGKERRMSWRDIEWDAGDQGR